MQGRPRIRVRLRPAFEWGARQPDRSRAAATTCASSAPNQSLRLTTDAPISYVAEERPFVVDRPFSFFFGADEPLTRRGRPRPRASSSTRRSDYWRDWVRSLSIPFDWQEAVIRAAITLKLCNYEETGAIVAALTTSVPEAPGTQRNWDYRFCWLRDAYFVVQALNRLGTTKTMEEYLTYITNIVDDADADPAPQRPAAALSASPARPTSRSATAAGARRLSRHGAGAGRQRRLDADPERRLRRVVLASTHAFFDRRLIRPANPALFEHLETAGRRARSRSSTSRTPAPGSCAPRRPCTPSRA